MIRLIVLSIVLGATPVLAATLPHDVENFVARRDRCNHFRVEDAEDPIRSEEIRKALLESCGGTDAELARLTHRYASNSIIRERLQGFDTQIEAVAPRRQGGERPQHGK